MLAAILLRIYWILGFLVVPILHRLFTKRVAIGKEILSRKNERFGIPSCSRPEGRLIWVHAASVGETNSIMELVRNYSEREWTVLLTTGTVTSARLVSTILPKNAIHQFVPYDAAPLVGRFLKHWRPDAAIMVESEIWPMIVYGLELKKIPCVLVNGRMSIASLRKWQRIPGAGERIFGSVSLCLAQSELDADRFKLLGVTRVETPGNLKFDTEPLPVDENGLTSLKKQIGSRKFWLAASTHSGEEELVVQAHLLLAEQFPDLLTIIVPRHPERGKEVEQICSDSNLTVNRRSNNLAISSQDEVYVADTLGELGLFYRLCDIAFLGGSLVEIGGHNPVEPAQLDCAILTGPNFDKNKRMFDTFLEAEGTLVVNNVAELANEVLILLNQEEDLRETSGNAKRIVETNRGALDRSVKFLDEVLANAGQIE